jgi:hypothetical protein
MPYRCCVPLCKGNYGYGDAPNVTVFSFPQDQELKKKWLKAIPCADLIPKKFSKVCQLHFKVEDIISDAPKVDKKPVSLPLPV